MLNLKKKRQTFFKEYFVMNCTKCLLQVNQYDANYKVFCERPAKYFHAKAQNSSFSSNIFNTLTNSYIVILRENYNFLPMILKIKISNEIGLQLKKLALNPILNKGFNFAILQESEKIPDVIEELSR